MNEEKSEFWTDTWPGRFLLNSVGYILVFFPILIGLFVTKKILKLDPTILTEKTWEWFHTLLTKKSVPNTEAGALILVISGARMSIKVDASSRCSFAPSSAWGSKDTMTIRKTHPTLDSEL